VNIPAPPRVSLTGRPSGPTMPTRFSNLRVPHTLVLRMGLGFLFAQSQQCLREVAVAGLQTRAFSTLRLAQTCLRVGSYDLTSPTLFSCFSRACLPKRPAPTSNNFPHSISEAIP
jgi:hypothetical protein